MRRGWPHVALATMLAVVLTHTPSPSPAAAAPLREGIPESLTERSSSAHFTVHYTTSDPAHAIPADSVPGILAIAEQAYATEVNETTGFGPPLDDGDGRIDVYVRKLEEDVAITRGDRPTPERPNQASAYIELDPGAAAAQGADGALRYVMPHELFHVLQFSYSGREALWMAEATAEWAARSLARAHFYARPEENWFRNPNQPLDCFEVSCGGTPVEERAWQGYDRWPFFRHLEERHGPRIVHEIWVQSRALSGDGGEHAVEAIEAALRGRGTTLAQEFAAFAARAGASDWRLAELQRWGPTPVTGFRTGSRRRPTSRSRTVAVGHLAASYVTLAGGRRPEALSVCVPARLALRVTQPAGQAEPPALLVPSRRGTTRIKHLSGGGGTWSLDRRWSTCQDATAMLALANTSWTDPGRFTVAAQVVPRKRLRVSRRQPAIDFYLELARRQRVRAELTLPRTRGRPERRIVRRVRVPRGSRPASLPLPRRGPNGRYRLAVRFEDAAERAARARAKFRVRLR